MRCELFRRHARHKLVMPGLAAFAKASAGRANSWPRRSLGGGGSRASTFFVPRERSWMAGTSPGMTMWNACAKADQRHMRLPYPQAGEVEQACGPTDSTQSHSALAGTDCQPSTLNDDHCGLLVRGAPASRRYARLARRWECLPQALLHIHRPVARNACRQPACRARALAYATADGQSR
jgi:hypothetical protein